MFSTKISPAPAAFLLISLAAGCSESPTGASTTELRASANQSAAHTPFTGTLYGCSGSNPRELRVTPGGVLHFEGANNVNLWVSDNPLVNGVETNFVSANINLNEGIGRAHGTGTIAPEGIAGTWVIDFLVKIGGQVGGHAYGSGYGTGDLAGLRVDFVVEPVSGPAVNLCNADFPFVASFSGAIFGGAN